MSARVGLSSEEYAPFIWQPMIRVTDSGDVKIYRKDALVERKDFTAKNAEIVAEREKPATGIRANPIFLPAPHNVALALITSFMTSPKRGRDLWLHSKK